MSCLLSFKSYSQQMILNDKGEVNYLLTKSQVKFLLKQNYRAEELFRLDSICENQSSLKDSIIFKDSKIKLDYLKVIDNSKQEIELQSYQINILNKYTKSLEKSVRKQKAYKWMAIAGGFAGIIGTAFIMK